MSAWNSTTRECNPTYCVALMRFFSAQCIFPTVHQTRLIWVSGDKIFIYLVNHPSLSELVNTWWDCNSPSLAHLFQLNWQADKVQSCNNVSVQTAGTGKQSITCQSLAIIKYYLKVKQNAEYTNSNVRFIAVAKKRFFLTW